MKILSDVVKKSKCLGCGACSNACPNKSITMELDNEGFYKPVINSAECLKCGLCDKTCPVLNFSFDNKKTPDCYALMASDEVRKVSSSGGAFTIFALEIFRKGGVVCGVKYSDDKKKTFYTVIDSADDLDIIRGSKYIMCDTGDIYKKVENFIIQKKYVLFCGLPCHVAGLKSYLKNKFVSEYLLAIDLICHGIGSVKAFNNYIRDAHQNRDISSLGFKDKRYGWHASMTIEFSDGGFYNSPCEIDEYFSSYLNGLNKNRCCGECKFAAIPRQGDLTIGDFWGINDYNPNFNDGKGTSVVLVNNSKGEDYLRSIKDKVKLCECVPLEYATHKNSNLIKSPKVSASNSQFLRKLDERRYPDLVRWGTAEKRYDIGIVGIPVFPNFGGTLTYYSLYRCLKDLGFSVALFSRPRSTGKAPIIPDEVYNQCPFDLDDLKLDFKDKTMMSAFANANCDGFVVGSDQLFNSDLYKAFGEIVALDWISDNHLKIAYAASFGHDYFWGPENQRAKMAYYMQKFDAFSVREEEGISLAKNTFGVDARWVLDPVFLCDPSHYYKISENSRTKNDSPHIFAYILDPASDKEAILSYSEEKLGLDSELYSEMLYMPSEDAVRMAQDRFGHKLLNGKVEDRLYSLIHSDFVVTDSFHGVCFAIIFKKPFIAILNSLRGASRFYSILGKFHLLDRLVTSFEELSSKGWLFDADYDCSEAYNLMIEEKQNSINWLIEALHSKDFSLKPYSVEDIIESKIHKYDKNILINTIKSNASLSEYKIYKNKNIYDYLDSLAKYLKNLIVFIAIKDTPGFALNQRIAVKLSNLGLKTDLRDKHWHSFVSVISNGRVVSEIISKHEERVAYLGNLSCGDVRMVSRSYNEGNVAYISINGVDYAENKRGLNIVVYDCVLGDVIDSVSFDTHDNLIPYFRFSKRNISVNPYAYKYETDMWLDSKKIELTNSGQLLQEQLPVYYCCKLAVKKSKGRKIVFWGDDLTFRKILQESFGVLVCNIIAQKTNSVQSDNVLSFEDIRNKNDEYYIIIPEKKWNASDEGYLRGLGYKDVDDYVYYYHRPIIIKDRIFESEPYSDCFGNRITGDVQYGLTIILRGYNNILSFGHDCSIKKDGGLVIDCSSNSEVVFGNNIRFVEDNDILLVSNSPKKLKLGNNIVFVNNTMRLFGDVGITELSVGDNTTFNTKTSLHVNSGKKLEIGTDVMFSFNIKVLCGDGHSIFDVVSEKNTNSSNNFEGIVVGDHVWVGLNTTILSGSSIGMGSVVGANSLVKGSFPNNCAIGGNVSRILKRDIAWSRKNCTDNISDCNMLYVNKTYEIDDISGKKVLILGGTRFMGIRLVERLLEKGCDITIATRGKHEDRFGNAVNRRIIDRNDEKSISDSFDNIKYDVIFDTTSYTPLSVRYSLSHINCERYIMVSSAAVYDDAITNRIEEQVDPYNIPYEVNGDFKYSDGKKFSECVLCQEFGKVNSAIVRIPAVLDLNNLSEGDLSNRLYFYVEHIIKEIPFEERNMDRPCCFVRTDEEADFLIYLAESSHNGVFNYSSFGTITLRNIINYIETKTNKKAIIQPNSEINPFVFGGYSMNLNKVVGLGYKPLMLEDWIYKLLDQYIKMFD